MFLNRLRTAFLGLAMVAAVAVAVCAQPSTAGREAGRRFAGETLTYEGKLKVMAMSFAVADLTFDGTESPDNSGLLIKAEATSKGTLASMFHFSFLQQVNSSIDLTGFRAAKTDKHDVQKDRVRDSQAVFDYTQKRVTYVETDPKDTMRAPRRIASDISDPSYDLVSAIYYIRLQDLAVGKTFTVEVSDSGLVYKVPVNVVAREKQSSPFGKVMCFRVEPDIFGPGKLIDSNGKMVIWLTADSRRIPVAAKVNARVGTINIKLKQYKEPTANDAAAAKFDAAARLEK
jgi:hypothetical protein